MIEDSIEKSKGYDYIEEALTGITLEDFDSPMSDNTDYMGKIPNETSET